MSSSMDTSPELDATHATNNGKYRISFEFQLDQGGGVTLCGDTGCGLGHTYPSCSYANTEQLL